MDTLTYAHGNLKTLGEVKFR